MILTVKKLKTHREKTRGLIGANPVYPVYFTTRWGIHTFGLICPIDVIILDNNFQVMKVIHNLLPNRIFLWNPTHRHVVELPAGWIKRKRIKTGTKIYLYD